MTTENVDDLSSAPDDDCPVEQWRSIADVPFDEGEDLLPGDYGGPGPLSDPMLLSKFDLIKDETEREIGPRRRIRMYGRLAGVVLLTVGLLLILLSSADFFLGLQMAFYGLMLTIGSFLFNERTTFEADGYGHVNKFGGMSSYRKMSDRNR